MPRSVLLHHLAADCGDHYDWLLASGEGPHDTDDRVLVAFRVAGRIDLATSGQVFEAERIADHRWLFLTYEGEISQGRGQVERVAAGIWTPRVIEDGTISGEIEWGGRSLSVFEGRRIDANRWRFQIDRPQRR
jgi:hypothetical protein